MPLTMPTTDRVILLCLDGASYDLLRPLGTAHRMPFLAELLERSALVRLEPAGLLSETTAWGDVFAGAGPEIHGQLDDVYLSQRRDLLLAADLDHLPAPTLQSTVAQEWGPAAVRCVASRLNKFGVWKRRPQTLEEIGHGGARMEMVLQSLARQAWEADPAWRLLMARIDALDVLQHRLWHLLGIDSECRAPRGWEESILAIYRSVDRCLTSFCRLAEHRGATVVLVSPYGFQSLQGRIDILELLSRRGLVQALSLPGQAGFIARRAARRVGRSLQRALRLPGARQWSQAIGGLHPIDWRRSPALTLHGETEGFVYLNTAERFGGRSASTPREREQTQSEIVAALQEAFHPLSGQPLFREVFCTAQRWGGDPRARGWPEVVALPAPGFMVRAALDQRHQVLRPDPRLSGTHSDQGLLAICQAGIATGQHCQAARIDVAPTVLAMLGIPCAPSMSDRVLHELFAAATDYDSATMGFRSTPRPSISTSTVSPG